MLQGETLLQGDRKETKMSIEALDFDALIADKYRPIEWVGKGAMGWVLKAEDVTLDDLPVAIKFLVAISCVLVANA